MRRSSMSAIIAWGAVLVMLTSMLPAMAAQSFKDLSGSWASEHVLSLARKGVIGGYPDGTFRPNDTVTRAELAKMATKAFQIPSASKQPFRDAKKHWAASEIASLSAANLIKGYEDGTFRPDQKINRAEITAIVVRALGIDDVVEAQKLTSTAFSDIPADHWAAGVTSAADRLDILPPYFKGRFRPNEPATRAEAAALINGALRLQIVGGTVDYADPAKYIMSIKTEDGTLHDFSISPSVTVYRNASLATADVLKAGDTIHVVADRFGTPVYVKAHGAATRNEVIAKVSDITKGLLTPEQLRAVIRGDWSAVASGFQVTLYNHLLDAGATPSEADAIMRKDWASLNGMGRARLTQALSTSLGISTELSVAMLSGNWEHAMQLAKVEVTEILLGRLLFGPNV